mgnify:CR=1 FL=1
MSLCWRHITFLVASDEPAELDLCYSQGRNENEKLAVKEKHLLLLLLPTHNGALFPNLTA